MSVENLKPLVGDYATLNEGNAVRFESIFSQGGASQSKVYTPQERRDTIAAVAGGETGLGGWKQGAGLR